MMRVGRVLITVKWLVWVLEGFKNRKEEWTQYMRE